MLVFNNFFQLTLNAQNSESDCSEPDDAKSPLLEPCQDIHPQPDENLPSTLPGSQSQNCFPSVNNIFMSRSVNDQTVKL